MNGGNAIQKRFRIENGSTGTASDVHIVFSAPVSAPKLTYQPEGCGGVYPNPTLTTTYVAGDTVNITWPEKCVKKAADRKAGEAQSWEGRVPVEFTTGPGNRLRISTNYLGNNPTVTDVKVSVDTCAGGQVLQATRKLPVDPYYGYWDITYNEKCIFIGSFMTAQIVSDPKGPEVPRVIAWVCNDNNCEIGARDLLESYLIRLGLFSDANGVKIRSITWTNQGNAIPTQAPGPPKDQSFTFFNNTKQKASGLKVVFSGQLLKTGIPVGPQGVYVGIGLGQQSVCNSPTTTPTPTPAVSTTNVDNDTVEITWPQKCIATGATSWEGIVPANFAQSGNRVRIYEYTDNPTLRPFRWNNVRVSVSTCDNGAFKKAVRKAPVGQFGENYWDVASYGTKCIRPGVSRIKAVIESKPGGGDARAVIRNDTTGYEAVFGLQNMGPIMPEQVSISVISRTNPLKVRQVTWMNAGNPIAIATPYTPTAKPTVTPTVTPTQTPRTPPPPVGGIFRQPAAGATPLESQPSSSSDAWLLTAVAAIAVAGAITLGGGAWYGRKRKSVR
jgi:hypothetical protein